MPQAVCGGWVTWKDLGRAAAGPTRLCIESLLAQVELGREEVWELLGARPAKFYQRTPEGPRIIKSPKSSGSCICQGRKTENP